MFLLATEFCKNTTNIWNVLGYVVTIIKIVIPLALIILGMVDLGKAVISSDDKAIGKAVGSLVKRFIAAVVFFFLPMLVMLLINMIKDSGFVNGDDIKQISCLFEP